MARSRRKFTDEFKHEAVRRAEKPDGNVSQVSQDLGLDPSMLRRWIPPSDRKRANERQRVVSVRAPRPATGLRQSAGAA